MQPQIKQLAVLGHGGFRRLAYAEWGSPRASRTIVCVHGVSRSGRDFDVLARTLVEHDARVVAPDLPGRGGSEWLASAAHYTDRAYTSAMAALIGRLDVAEIDWIGTSLGGHIGMMLASQYGTPVQRLVLNDFGARVSAAALRRIGGYLNRSWQFASLEELEHYLRDALAPFGNLTEAEWRHLALHSAVPDEAGGWRFHFDPAIGSRFAVPMWLDIVLWQLWDRIAGPVLIMRGENSDLLSTETVALMLKRGASAAAGRASAVEIPGCGHAPALMNKDQIATIRDFLFDGAREKSRANRGRRMTSTT
jgi:pimeloyl-ACP methyl ester carboxylesterase